VTAGEQTRVGTELLEQQQCVLDGRRAFVAERCWDLQNRLLVSLSEDTPSGVTVAVSTAT